MNLIIGEKTESNVEKIAASLVDEEPVPFLYEGIRFYSIGKDFETFFALGVKDYTLYKFVCSCEWNGETFIWQRKVHKLPGSNVGYIGI
jgi:hypothetical protein